LPHPPRDGAFFDLLIGSGNREEPLREEDGRRVHKGSPIASYPVVVTKVDRPTDDDYIDQIKRRMRRLYSRPDMAAAKFVVRSLLE
jgi:hypothetical protein